MNSLTGQNIVYLLAADSLVPDSPISPTRLQDKLGAKVARTWDEAIAIDKSTPINALIIHDSALSQVDRAWLANAYRRGVVMAGFNLYGPQMADLVNDPCIAKDKFAADPYPGSFYVIVSFSIAGNNPADVALVEDAYQRSCGEEPPAGGPSDYVSRASGRSTYDLNNDSDFNLFTQTLTNHFKR